MVYTNKNPFEAIKKGIKLSYEGEPSYIKQYYQNKFEVKEQTLSEKQAEGLTSILTMQALTDIDKLYDYILNKNGRSKNNNFNDLNQHLSLQLKQYYSAKELQPYINKDQIISDHTHEIAMHTINRVNTCLALQKLFLTAMTSFEELIGYKIMSATESTGHNQEIKAIKKILAQDNSEDRFSEHTLNIIASKIVGNLDGRSYNNIFNEKLLFLGDIQSWEKTNKDILSNIFNYVKTLEIYALNQLELNDKSMLVEFIQEKLDYNSNESIYNDINTVLKNS